MRAVLPAAVIRSALFLPVDGELVVEAVGLRSPELSVAVVDAAGFGVVLCKTRKHMTGMGNGMIGAKGREKKILTRPQQYSRGKPSWRIG
jgi:hypothetical protein